MMMPMVDAVTVMVQDICQLPAAAAMADRITGPTKFARLNIWVMSPTTADAEPPGGAISTAWRVTVVGTRAPTNEKIAAANSAQATLPGTRDQSGAKTNTDMIAIMVSPVMINVRGAWPRCSSTPVTTLAMPLRPPTRAVATPTMIATPTGGDVGCTKDGGQEAQD